MKLKTKLLWPLTGVGAISLPIFQVVACSAASQPETPIVFNNHQFSSVKELATWAEQNLTQTALDSNTQWSIFDGTKNIYFNSPVEAANFVLQNKTIFEDKAYISESVMTYLVQLSTNEIDQASKSGQITSYPLTKDVRAIMPIYRGVSDVRYETEDEAASSFLQIHNAYFFDNKYFLSKESLEAYLNAPHGATNDEESAWWTKVLGEQKNYQVLTALKNAKQITNLNDDNRAVSDRLPQDAASGTIFEDRLRNFVTSNATRAVFDPQKPQGEQYLTLDRDALSTISEDTLPHIKFRTGNKAAFVADVTNDTPGTLFAPYIIESESNISASLPNTANWMKSHVDKGESYRAKYTGAILNSVYSIVINGEGVDNITEALFTEKFYELSAEQQAKLSNSDYNYAIVQKAMTTFRDLFGNAAFASRNGGGKNFNVFEELKRVEKSYEQGKRYGVITTLPLLRGLLLKWAADAQLSNKYFNAINEAFDALLQTIDFKTHDLYDAYLDETSQQFRLARVFGFSINKEQFEGTDYYLEKINAEVGYKNVANPGGVSMALIIGAVNGITGLIEGERQYLNEVIANLGSTKASSKTDDKRMFAELVQDLIKYQLPISYDQIGRAQASFNNMRTEINRAAFNYGINLSDGASIVGNFDFLRVSEIYNEIYKERSTEREALFARISSIFAEKTLPYISTAQNEYKQELKLVSDRNTLASFFTPEAIEALKAENSNEVLDAWDHYLTLIEDVSSKAKSSANTITKLLEPATELVIKALQKSTAKQALIITNNMMQQFQSLENVTKITIKVQEIESTSKFVRAALKIANGVAKAAMVVAAVAVVVDLVFSIIDAVVGRQVIDTYEYNAPDGATYYWNGGSHKDHKLSLFGIDIASWTSDTVGLEKLKFVDTTEVMPATNTGFYSMNTWFNNFDSLKSFYISKVLSGEFVSDLGYSITLVNKDGAISKLEARDLETLITNIKNFIKTRPDYLVQIALDKNNKVLVTPNAQKAANVQAVLSYLQPIWIAQLPQLENSALVLREFRLPASPTTPLYGLDYQGTDPLKRQYYFYDPNLANYTLTTSLQTVSSGVGPATQANGQPLVKQGEFQYFNAAEVRQNFINKFKSDFTIEHKWALKVEAFAQGKYQAVPRLLDYQAENPTNEPALVTIWRATNPTGVSAVFIDKGSALTWMLGEMAFARRDLNSTDHWYWYEDQKFLSVAEFVRYVLAVVKKTNQEGA